MLGPKTRAEAEKKRYGVWIAGGNPGQAYDPKRCAEPVRTKERWSREHQCERKPGYGPDGLYCRQHDPDAVKRRDEERNKKYREQTERERPKWYATEMLEIIRKIAEGHNDPAALCRAFIRKFDKEGK